MDSYHKQELGPFESICRKLQMDWETTKQDIYFVAELMKAGNCDRDCFVQLHRTHVYNNNATAPVNKHDPKQQQSRAHLVYEDLHFVSYLVIRQS